MSVSAWQPVLKVFLVCEGLSLSVWLKGCSVLCRRPCCSLTHMSKYCRLTDRSNVGEGITGQKGQSVTGQKHRAFWLGVNFEVKGFKLLCDYMVPDSSLAWGYWHMPSPIFLHLFSACAVGSENTGRLEEAKTQTRATRSDIRVDLSALKTNQSKLTETQNSTGSA